jgi:site-specific recombinase XerD
VYIGETILKELPQYTQPLLEDFKAFLIGAGRAESTTDSYFHDAVRYLQFLAKTDPDLQLINFKKVTLKAFVYELTMEGIQKSTIQRRLMGVLAFWEYLNDMEMAEKPLKLKELKINIKPSTNPTKSLSHNDFIRYIEGLHDELAAIE